MNMQELEKRLQALEEIEAIKRLKARYCAMCDVTTATVWPGSLPRMRCRTAGTLGALRGAKPCGTSFAGSQELLCFAVHYVMNPLIEMSGEHATGRWYLLEPCTFAEGSRAVWGAAHYEDEYVKPSGEWKFKKVKLIAVLWTPFAQGWAKKRSMVD